jgi:hypothetical protein
LFFEFLTFDFNDVILLSLLKIKMNIYIVTKESRLLNWLRVVDTSRKFRIIRLSKLVTACEKTLQNSGAIAIVDWESKDVARGIDELNFDRFREIKSRFFICVNDLMLLSPSDAEFIRLALLQIGVGGVFSRLSELAVLSQTFIRLDQRLDSQSQSQFISTWKLLPWKRHATRSDF